MAWLMENRLPLASSVCCYYLPSADGQPQLSMLRAPQVFLKRLIILRNSKISVLKEHSVCAANEENKSWKQTITASVRVAIGTNDFSCCCEPADSFGADKSAELKNIRTDGERFQGKVFLWLINCCSFPSDWHTPKGRGAEEWKQAQGEFSLCESVFDSLPEKIKEHRRTEGGEQHK